MVRTTTHARGRDFPLLTLANFRVVHCIYDIKHGMLMKLIKRIMAKSLKKKKTVWAQCEDLKGIRATAQAVL